MERGIIIGGRYGEVVAREKSGSAFELGELLIAEQDGTRVLCQAYDLLFGSQVSEQNRELIAGMTLEEETDFEFLDAHLRQYTLAHLKELLTIRDEKPSLAKSLPGFFSKLRDVQESDFSFLTRPEDKLYLGALRSGSRELAVPISLSGRDVLSHHVLIPATTGRGKSNLLKVLLWGVVDEEYCGALVLDPHDEYYRPEESLRAHKNKERVKYYSPNPLPGTNSLLFSLKQLRPGHFDGAIAWSGPQREALAAYYREHRDDWIPAIVLGKGGVNDFHDATISVVRRKIMSLLGLEEREGRVYENSIFHTRKGESTINDIVDSLERAETVIVDTSGFAGSVEILIGSILSQEALRRYKRYKQQGTLRDKPVISVVLEEAPRVLGKEVLERGTNIFSTIAREGRKFNVGLVAITQLPSLIPRDILANMNTKIILGLEMRPERQAVIESASQDLSNDERAIASLDKGEAIVTTNFSPFAIPIKIPLFKDHAKNEGVVDKKAKSVPELKG